METGERKRRNGVTKKEQDYCKAKENFSVFSPSQFTISSRIQQFQVEKISSKNVHAVYIETFSHPQTCHFKDAKRKCGYILFLKNVPTSEHGAESEWKHLCPWWRQCDVDVNGFLLQKNDREVMDRTWTLASRHVIKCQCFHHEHWFARISKWVGLLCSRQKSFICCLFYWSCK